MGTIRSVSDLVQAANDGDLALLEGGEEWFSEMVAATLMELLAVMAKEGVCLEVNSSGLAKRFAEILHCPTILEWAADFDLHYTFGSDAHGVERVGAGYGEAMSALSQSQRARLHFMPGQENSPVPQARVYRFGTRSVRSASGSLIGPPARCEA